MSNSVRPHGRQPTRRPRPWDSPGKNTGVGYHFLLQCMKVKSESEVVQSCPTVTYQLLGPWDFSGKSTAKIINVRESLMGPVSGVSEVHATSSGTTSDLSLSSGRQICCTQIPYPLSYQCPSVHMESFYFLLQSLLWVTPHVSLAPAVSQS